LHIVDQTLLVCFNALFSATGAAQRPSAERSPPAVERLEAH
jgi:hypothetical protein